jgi:hypothetical protein
VFEEICLSEDSRESVKSGEKGEGVGGESKIFHIQYFNSRKIKEEAIKGYGRNRTRLYYTIKR